MIIIYTLTIILIIMLDQTSKYWAVKNFNPGFQSRNKFSFLTIVKNSGAAFGFLKKHPLFLKCISVILFLVLLFYLYLSASTGASVKKCISICLVAGGAGGNLTDRIRLGYVVDFIRTGRKLPVFNPADIFILTGSLLYLLSDPF